LISLLYHFPRENARGETDIFAPLTDFPENPSLFPLPSAEKSVTMVLVKIFDEFRLVSGVLSPSSSPTAPPSPSKGKAIVQTSFVLP
jgi:hypothetical protein